MRRDFENKNVLISGGSSGLGLQLAIASVMRGARVTILGRSLVKLEHAQIAIASSAGRQVRIHAIDVLAIDEPKAFENWIEEQPPHILINAIGRSDRGPSMSLTQLEYEQLFRDNVLAAWNITRHCLPSLRQNRGSVVNIGSLAGILSTPNMGGYCTTKFALTALTRQWRHEFREQSIHVMLVCPGPIRRDDSSQRYGEVISNRGLDAEQASKPGGGAKVKLLDPERLSHTILDGILSRKCEMVLPAKARYLAAMTALWPSLADRILRRYLD
jgi:short-subunit dehydrogenase